MFAAADVVILERGNSMPTYYIKVKGRLDKHWAAWFDGMTVTSHDNGDTVLHGPLVDQAALHGVLVKVRDLGLPLLAVSLVAPSES
jgi:hypothetical protein